MIESDVAKVGPQVGNVACVRCHKRITFNKQVSSPFTSATLDWGTMLYLGSNPVGYGSAPAPSAYEMFGAKVVAICYDCRFPQPKCAKCGK